MFTFEERDDGFIVLAADGRGVAHVEAATTTSWLKTDKDGKATMQYTRKLLPKEEWWVHFTCHKFSTEELEIFLAKLKALQG